MATYQGTISGTGNSETRENEITADNVAIFRNFAIGYSLDTKDAGGVIYDPKHDFYAWVEDDGSGYSNTLHISDGVAFAYGYFGMVKETSFTFLPPAVEQYHLIYLELDRSVIPNKATIKIKNNQGSNRVLPNSFRRDELSFVKTGVNQIPLWLIKVTNKGILCENLEDVKGVDLRKRRKYIENVHNSDTSHHVVFSSNDINGVGENVTCPTAPIHSNSNIIANCEFVCREIIDAIAR